MITKWSPSRINENNLGWGINWQVERCVGETDPLCYPLSGVI